MWGKPLLLLHWQDSKMRKMIEERTGTDKDNTFYVLNPKVNDIPDKYGKLYHGVRLQNILYREWEERTFDCFRM